MLLVKITGSIFVFCTFVNHATNSPFFRLKLANIRILMKNILTAAAFFQALPFLPKRRQKTLPFRGRPKIFNPMTRYTLKLRALSHL